MDPQVAAFKQLSGMQDLPTNGKEALEASLRFIYVGLSTLRIDPLLSQLASQRPVPLTTSAKQKFVDVSTGMRLRYLEWPGGGRDVVLLLHDIAECAEVWDQVGNKLSGRGYKVVALDLRGHGGSSRSGEGRYSAALLAEDVQAFIVAKDLYVRPVAVIGSGIGAAVALTLAQAAPALVGAVTAVEFGLPAALAQAAAARMAAYEEQHKAQSQSWDAVIRPERGRNVQVIASAEVLPWWSFWLGQGAEFGSVAECTAYLCSPLANLGPAVLLQLASVAAANAAHPSQGPQQQQQQDEEEGKEQRVALHETLAKLARAPASALPAAHAMLQSAPSWEHSDAEPAHHLKMDPQFFFSFDVARMAHGMASLPCHLLFLHGCHSAWVPREDASALAALATAAASHHVDCVANGGHHPATDAPHELLSKLIAFLEGPAACCFECPPSAAGRTGADARRPEALGLRPLPQYSSLEEAQRALGPRRIPTAALVEEELAKLQLETRQAGEGWSENREEGGPQAVEYFGFVG